MTSVHIIHMARRKKLHPSLVISENVAADTQSCEWPECRSKGEHKAPRSRERLREYRWFCLDHVREYNKRWNFLEGMSDDEVEATLRHDTVWNRPSWPIGNNDDGVKPKKRGPKPGIGPFGIDPEYFIDGFGLFDNDAGIIDKPGPDAPTRAALATFGLDLPISEDALKSKYKELVKKHHPDANVGKQDAGEKFKEIKEAYETLRQFLVL